MSVKKTSSPLSSGSEAVDSLGGKDELKRGKVEKSFEAALAELSGQLEQAGSEKTDSPTRAKFQQIASEGNLDSQEGAMTAVNESAKFLVGSRLSKDLRNSDEGKKVAEDLGNYLSKDPMMHKKILGILQRLK